MSSPSPDAVAAAAAALANMRVQDYLNDQIDRYRQLMETGVDPLATGDDPLGRSVYAVYPETGIFKKLIECFKAIPAYADLDWSQLHTTYNGVMFVLANGEGLEALGFASSSVVRQIRELFDATRQVDRRQCVPMMAVLAEASKQDGWKKVLGHAGFLTSMSDAMTGTPSVRDCLKQAMRVAGNCCIENDDNRRRWIECGGYRHMVSCLADECAHVYSLAVPALVNVCEDYEPAQKAVFRNGCSWMLVDLLGRLDADSKGHAICSHAAKLLDLAPDDDDLSTSSLDAAYTLIRMTCDASLDDYDRAVYIHRAIAHLRFDEHKQFMTEGRNGSSLFALLDVMQSSYFVNAKQLPPAPTEDDPLTTDPLTTDTNVLIPETDADRVYLKVRNALAEAIGDVAADPEFLRRHTDNASLSAMAPYFARYLGDDPRPLVQLCCAFIVGNIAQSDGVCGFLVQNVKVHRRLIRLLQPSKPETLVFTALGALCNLALPIRTKTALGDDGLIAALGRIWATAGFLPEVHIKAATVAGRLVHHHLANVKRLLKDAGPEPAPLEALMAVFERAGDQETRLAYARVVAAILRTIYADRSLDDNARNEIVKRFWAVHAGLARTLGAMLTLQHRGPAFTPKQSGDARSEGWFAVALAARSAAGARALIPVLEREELVEILQGPMAGEGRKEDVENVKVVMHELAKNKGSTPAGGALRAMIKKAL